MSLRVGRYVLHDEIAHGGMATVYFGRLHGSAGFSRAVAIKRLHPQFARDPEFVAMFLDEAHLAARIRHPNVVSTLDVINEGEELLLVMDYIAGESLSRLLKKGRVPPRIAASILVGTLQGLHAAHEARDERGQPLHVVHRDVSPHNIIVGTDGVARVVDFGVAKAVGRLQTTRDGQLKGKLAYMAPEQFRSEEITRTVDIRAAGLVFFEALTGTRMITGENDAAIVERVLYGAFTPPSEIEESIPPTLDVVIERAVQEKPGARYETAREMAHAIEEAIDVASVHEVSDWLQRIAADTLAVRAHAMEVLTETIAQRSSRWWLAVPTALLAVAAVVAILPKNDRLAPPAPAAATSAATPPASTTDTTAAPTPAPTPVPSPAVEHTAKKSPPNRKPIAAPAKSKSLLPSGLPDDRN